MTELLKRRTRRLRWASLAWLLVLPPINLYYGFLNNGQRGAHSLVTDLDRALPFVPLFIVPYLLCYGYVIAGLVHLCIRDTALYGRTLAALALTLLACYTVYYGYQTTVPRPPVTGDGALAWLVRWMQRQDAPYNCFPSIHVASSYLLLRAYAACRHVSAAAQAAAGAFSLTVIASTFFLKQHVFMDAVGAVIVVEAAQLAVRGAIMLWKGALSPYGARNDPARR